MSSLSRGVSVGNGGRMSWLTVAVGCMAVVVVDGGFVVVLVVVVVEVVVVVGGFVVVVRVVGLLVVVVLGRQVGSLVIVVVDGVTEHPVAVLVVDGEQVAVVVIVPSCVRYRGLHTTVTCGAVVFVHGVVLGVQVACFVTVVVVGVTEQPVTVTVVDGAQVSVGVIVLSWVRYLVLQLIVTWSAVVSLHVDVVSEVVCVDVGSLEGVVLVIDPTEVLSSSSSSSSSSSLSSSLSSSSSLLSSLLLSSDGGSSLLLSSLLLSSDGGSSLLLLLPVSSPSNKFDKLSFNPGIGPGRFASISLATIQTLVILSAYEAHQPEGIGKVRHILRHIYAAVVLPLQRRKRAVDMSSRL